MPRPRLARPLLFALLLALLLSPGPDDVARATDLGRGNEQVKRAYEAYVKGGPRLEASEASRRVLITGFGLFSGVEFNISGVVLQSMADPTFWPTEAKLDALPKPPAKAVGAGTLTAKDGGARAWQRTLVIDGRTYEVAFLLVDVLWDLGAAITLFEAEHFEPHLIVMTGRGGKAAVFERGALNRAAPYTGFRHDGRPDPTNKPVAQSVLDPQHPGVEQAIAMSWDNERLAAAARPIVASMRAGYEVVAAPAARPDNTYICNNISCVVLHGLQGRKVALAGGAIELEVAGLAETAAGFFHYPARATREPAEVQAWARMLATVVKTHFAAKAPARRRARPADAGSR